MTPPRNRGPDDRLKQRRRASHSMESVMTEAVRLLDEAGDSALTFRALAARMGGGVGSIYWYVSSRDELLERAADFVLEGVLEATEDFVDGDPIDDLRSTAIALFEAVVDRPWLGAYFMRNTGSQPNSLRYYERVGQQVLRLGLGPLETFNAASAVVGYVVGIAADLGQQPPEEVIDGSTTRAEYMSRTVDEWRGLDPATWPFLHTILDVFADHDDSAQFVAGLDLLLAGLRLQAGD
ncbi:MULTISPECIES: TetR/AcrR family transcriptional regulator [unclassified Aeromicrobium]|uniref:TetR/AcrR family transcriptional regulator n=1 Tax=unclassified Aeromicrobium TaxID=2633570 RepID=UPI0006FC17C4|nr:MULTISPECIES: TetR/AcrR family transcriptional regulator C-terminal domain-containing protein [unclassified Aeromicrobium]KQP77828.1 TetR family transcriptional regulator [Aeromicrobium sp. Leaf289]KQP83465.1 TetR family transcriptional regulator [Aeromicrobium sp. Leaf291]